MFTLRPADMPRAHTLDAPAGIAVKLHDVMARNTVAQPLDFQPHCMAYAGELLEEWRSFRPEGAAQLQAEMPKLIAHARASNHLDILLCLKDVAVNPADAKEIRTAVDALLNAATQHMSPEERKRHTAPIQKKLSNAIFPALTETDKTEFRLNMTRSEMKAYAPQEQDMRDVGKAAMRAYRFTRLSEKLNPKDYIDKSIMPLKHALFQNQAAPWMIELLSFMHTEPGTQNTVREEMMQWEMEGKNSAASHYLAPVRPVTYLPVEGMTGQQIMLGLEMLAAKRYVTPIDAVRMGQLLETLQMERAEDGRKLLKARYEALRERAIESKNKTFLYAWGQAITSTGEPLKTIGMLNRATGDALKAIEPENLVGQWSRSWDPSACETQLQDLLTQRDSQRLPLLGMLLQRHQYLAEALRDTEGEHALKYDVEALFKLAEKSGFMDGAQAVSYMRTEPGQQLADRLRLREMERKQNVPEATPLSKQAHQMLMDHDIFYHEDSKLEPTDAHKFKPAEPDYWQKHLSGEGSDKAKDKDNTALNARYWLN